MIELKVIELKVITNDYRKLIHLLNIGINCSTVIIENKHEISKNKGISCCLEDLKQFLTKANTNSHGFNSGLYAGK